MPKVAWIRMTAASIGWGCDGDNGSDGTAANHLGQMTGRSCGGYGWRLALAFRRTSLEGRDRVCAMEWSRQKIIEKKVAKINFKVVSCIGTHAHTQTLSSRVSSREVCRLGKAVMSMLRLNCADSCHPSPHADEMRKSCSSSVQKGRRRVELSQGSGRRS